MAKNFNAVWNQEILLEEPYSELVTDVPEELLPEAYEALNRFYQKEQRKNKPIKKGKQCWQ